MLPCAMFDLEAMRNAIEMVHCAQQEKLFRMDGYRVIWSGELDTQKQKAGQRPAPPDQELSHKRPAFPAGFGHAKEGQGVIDLRDRCVRKQPQT